MKLKVTVAEFVKNRNSKIPLVGELSPQRRSYEALIANGNRTRPGLIDEMEARDLSCLVQRLRQGKRHLVNRATRIQRSTLELTHVELKIDHVPAPIRPSP